MSKAGSARRQPTKKRRWSSAVTRNSDALDLERNVFAKETPVAIARSLKRSAERSSRRKSAPYRSAMSMLTFYINRAGRICPKADCASWSVRKGNCAKHSGENERHETWAHSR